LRWLSRQTGAPTIDMDVWLALEHDRGFLWWDAVHLTSAGQELMAEELARRLPPLLRD
jgi:hypothetical protein